MRRRPKDIKLGDFVDDKTKKDLVKSVGTLGKTDRTSRDALLGYLSEARTIQEVMVRFGYVSLNTAYQAISRLLKTKEVSNVGHGLYVSNVAGVTEFNLGQLSEHDLQERGLDAFNAHLRATKGSRQAPRPSKVTISSWKDRKKAIAAFCRTPKTRTEIAKEFGYSDPTSVSGMVLALEEDGLVTTKKGPRGTYLYQQVKPEVATVLPKPAPVMQEPSVEELPHHSEDEDTSEPIIEHDHINPEPQPKAPKLTLTQHAAQYAWEHKLSDYDSTSLRTYVAFMEYVEAKEAEGDL